MVPAGAMTAACCADMRSFAAAGCTCDADVMDLLVGLKVLPPGASPDATMSGIVSLFQVSQCAGSALGGPLLDACTGSVGCVATA
jgi:predicted MFS family arabinose efflux permease